MDRKAQQELNDRKARVKSELTVAVIRHNKAMEKLARSLDEALRACKEDMARFGNQRELLARSRMSERVINSSLKMIEGHRLQLWMINDREIEEGLEQ